MCKLGLRLANPKLEKPPSKDLIHKDKKITLVGEIIPERQGERDSHWTSGQTLKPTVSPKDY